MTFQPGTTFTQHPGMTFTQYPGMTFQPPHSETPFTYQPRMTSGYPPIPYPFSLGESSPTSRHNVADSLDWSVPIMTEHGLTDSLIPHPCRQEWAAISDPPEVTRADYKKSLSLTACLKKMYTNLSSKKQRLRHHERRDMGEASSSRISTSRTRTFDCSHSARDPPVRQRFGDNDDDDEMCASLNFGSRNRD